MDLLQKQTDFQSLNYPTISVETHTAVRISYLMYALVSTFYNLQLTFHNYICHNIISRCFNYEFIKINS